jgi:hypothetical protein
MSERQQNPAHFSFLEIIRLLHTTAGPAFAKGALVKHGIAAARASTERAFTTLEDFIASIDKLDNPIAQFEGQAKHYGNGVFGLPRCPFAASIESHKDANGALPPQYDEVTAEMNKPTAATEHLRVGQGTAVSPFCAVHQPLRSAMGERITVAGRAMKIFQRGCRSAAGKRCIADALLEQAGVDRALVDEILDDNMCCYCIRFETDD